MLRFQQSTIANKILLGFLPLIVLLGGIPIFALVNLDKLTEMNQKMVHEDLFVLESIDDLFNELFLQESFGQHYLIRQTEEIKQRFIDHGDVFKTVLSKLKNSAFNSALLKKIDEIYVHHHRYHMLYLTHYQASEALFADNPTINNKKISIQFDELSRLINEVKKDAYEHQESQIRQMASISDRAYRIMAGLAIGGILIGIGSAFMAFRYTRRSIHKLIRATQEIAGGNFNVVPQIKGAGELQTLAEAFSKMGNRLATLEKRNLDTNPLTHLPGGATIETVLETRLENKLPSAFCLVDIDNFKAFNDRYGYATGNSIIKETATIIQAATSRFGTDHDFVGHIGGDDFVFLTIPEKYEDICREIIDRFDARVPKFYTLEDAERGFIESTSRQGEEMHFPIMTLSIAVVTNVGRSESNHIRFGEIAAELKKKAKNIDGSVFVVDQRRE
jgi:diguanylate cyclase (GGDEF)-like protein